MNTKQIADEWERLINTPGATDTVPVDCRKLPESTLKFLNWYFQAGLEIRQVVLADGSDNLDGSYLFHIPGDDYAPYFNHLPRREVHMWANAGFHEAVDNNLVIARLLELATGAPAQLAMPIFRAMDREADRRQVENN